MANDIKRFCETDTGTNLISQSDYLNDNQRLIGNQPGIARSKLVNKVLRQTSSVAAGIGACLNNAVANTGTQLINETLTDSQFQNYMKTFVGQNGIPSYNGEVINDDLSKITFIKIYHDPNTIFNFHFITVWDLSEQNKYSNMILQVVNSQNSSDELYQFSIYGRANSSVPRNSIPYYDSCMLLYFEEGQAFYVNNFNDSSKNYHVTFDTVSETDEGTIYNDITINTDFNLDELSKNWPISDPTGNSYTITLQSLIDVIDYPFAARLLIPSLSASGGFVKVPIRLWNDGTNIPLNQLFTKDETITLRLREEEGTPPSFIAYAQFSEIDKNSIVTYYGVDTLNSNNAIGAQTDTIAYSAITAYPDRPMMFVVHSNYNKTLTSKTFILNSMTLGTVGSFSMTAGKKYMFLYLGQGSIFVLNPDPFVTSSEFDLSDNYSLSNSALNFNSSIIRNNTTKNQQIYISFGLNNASAAYNGNVSLNIYMRNSNTINIVLIKSRNWGVGDTDGFIFTLLPGQGYNITTNGEGFVANQSIMSI